MHLLNRISHCLAGMAIFGIGLLPVSAFPADSANYDTAWTYVHDGGLTVDNKVIDDNFRDIEILPNGDALFVGESRDSTYLQNILLVQVSVSGKTVRKKLFGFNYGSGGASILLANNGDYFIGGKKNASPLLLRLDTSFAIKSSTWYYDSIAHSSLLLKSSIIQSMVQSSNGKILATAGDMFPDNDGQALNNYAVWMEFDSTDYQKVRIREWLDFGGHRFSGWSIASSGTGGYLMGGNQSVASLDSAGIMVSPTKYTFSLPGVGTEINNVTHIRRLRDGRLMAVGQAYEEDCWTRYQRLYFDGWWSELGSTGTSTAWNTAGVSGSNDIINDVAQLVGGNLVFVGKKSGGIESGGVWAIVTDSTGKKILWEKQILVPYKTANGKAAEAYSVAATPDSGFTVVGPYFLSAALGGKNAFAVHVVPKPIPVSVWPKLTVRREQSHGAGGMVFTYHAPSGADIILKVFNIDGKETYRAIRRMGHAGLGKIDISDYSIKGGVHFWELSVGKTLNRGAFVSAK